MTSAVDLAENITACVPPPLYAAGHRERRYLRRPMVAASGEYTGLLQWGTRRLACTIEDLHFGGARLRLTEEPPLDGNGPSELPSELAIYYGSALISRITTLSVRWRLSGYLGIEFLTDDSVSLQEVSAVHQRVKAAFRPTLVVTDPVRMGLVLHFSVCAVSEASAQLVTSLSNRHILPGYRFVGATLLLPGLGVFSIGFTVRAVRPGDKHLLVDVDLHHVDPDARNAWAQFSTFAVAHADAAPASRRLPLLSSMRRLGAAVRVEPLSCAADYKAMLAVRLVAYQAAGILPETATMEDMADTFDHRSAIVIARLAGTVIGTARVIFCTTEADSFHFETDIPLSALGDLTRTSHVEVSRLAVIPHAQGTDVMAALLKEIARIALFNGKRGICLARTTQRTSYAKFGWTQASYEIPHPLLEGQTLALMTWNPSDFLSGASISKRVRSLITPDIVANMAVAGIRHPEQRDIGPQIAVAADG